MKIKKQGVTLVSVLIIVVVLSILTATVTISTNSIIKNTFNKEFVREYALVKSAVSDYIVRNSGIVDFETDEIDLTSVDAEDLNQFNVQDIENNVIECYVVDLQKIGIKDATYGTSQTEDDVYVVSRNTKTLYYKKGFSYNNNTYYVAVED